MEIKIIDSLQELLGELNEQNIQGAEREEIIWRYISYKSRNEGIPVSGSFELTPFCNLDCKMCYVHLEAKQCNERLKSVEEWKSIIHQAADSGMLMAELTGGECLTYPGFKEIYLYLISLGIRVSVLTNGRLLTDEMVSFFSEYPPKGIQVSVYGSCEDAYEKVTGHRAFQEVMDGIARVKKAGLALQISITPNKYMQDDIDELLSLVHSLQVPYRISGVTLSARSETGRKIEEYAVDCDAYVLMQKKDRAYIQSNTDVSRTAPRTIYAPPSKEEIPGLPCGGGKSGFHVNWKGRLCPCIAFESISYSIGEQGFMNAWHKVQEAMACYVMPNECTECAFSEYCTSCSGEKTNGQLHGNLNRYVCQRIKSLIDEAEIHNWNNNCEPNTDIK